MGAHIRSPAVAGLFYPEDSVALRAAVQAFLADARGGDGAPPKALIAPHAGYMYSGPVAGSAYARLAPSAARIRRVVLLGPAHRVAVHGLVGPTAAAFQTPLGAVPVDQALLAELTALPQVTLDDGPHAREHGLEVHLPFLQALLSDWSLVPILVGAASSAEVQRVLERCWGGSETLIVISTDLSHYLDQASARLIDDETAAAIERLDGHAIGSHAACGRSALRGLLAAARDRAMAVERLDLRTSGDTAGDKARVVGYGAW
ncbi:MAG: AmmeMemoRadiSam system protein B, partial [Myxococcales bacterium]|nr:AmmeMemoRadiSam system protein B [Myxococcales bacterium]